MRSQMLVSLAVLVTAFSGCDHAVEPTEPTLQVRNQNNPGIHEIQRYTTAVFVADPKGWTVDGPVIGVSIPGGAVTATVPTDTTVHVTCHKRGTGQFPVDLKGPGGQISTYTLNIKCVDRIAGSTAHPVNLTEHFAVQGRVVLSIAVDPSELAEQVVLNAYLLAFAADNSHALHTSGGIGLKCQEAGEGTLFVTFQSGSDDYDLSCTVEHNQGGGS